jgi:hypothetical protein
MSTAGKWASAPWNYAHLHVFANQEPIEDGPGGSGRCFTYALLLWGPKAVL